MKNHKKPKQSSDQSERGTIKNGSTDIKSHKQSSGADSNYQHDQNSSKTSNDSGKKGHYRGDGCC